MCLSTSTIISVTGIVKVGVIVPVVQHSRILESFLLLLTSLIYGASMAGL